ncbi:MAG: cupin domain-containing protein [Bacilli bacterium]|nr:cupin domain-containing protein [Bacilli bacterium]
MKYIKYEKATNIKNSNTSTLLEYSLELQDKEIDFAINTISGRYPEKGYCTNKKCKEIAYILEGTGKICKKDQEVIFKKGDLIQIDREEFYYWEGDCKIIMVCTPAWYKEQCEIIQE